MNKNLVEIWKNCSLRPNNWDHMIVMFLGFSIYQFYKLNNAPFMIAFGLIFIFKMTGYITYLTQSSVNIDKIETTKAKRIYKLLEAEDE